MTSTAHPARIHPHTTVRAERDRVTASRRLRAVLLTNALTSGVVGAITALAPGAVDDLLGTGHDGWLRLFGGIGFLVFAAAVGALARCSPATRARYAPLVSVFDAAYVLGVVVTVTAGWYSTTGDWVMAATAALVAEFAVGQVWFAAPQPLTQPAIVYGRPDDPQHACGGCRRAQRRRPDLHQRRVLPPQRGEDLGVRQRVPRGRRHLGGHPAAPR